MTAPDARPDNNYKVHPTAVFTPMHDGPVLAENRLGPADAQKALEAYSNMAIRIRHSKDVHILNLLSQYYVMKFQRPPGRTRIRAWASSALCGALFGEFPAPRHLLPGCIQYEARRLKELHKLGVRVPRVHLISDDHLILEHCGETFENLLKAAPAPQRSELLWAVVDDLIAFHQAGHWHGGAQVRNLTLKDGLIYRIDFEEQLGEALPLAHAQAFDVLLAFNSLIDYLHGDRTRLGVALLSHYLERAASPELVTTLARLDRWFRRYRRLESRLPSSLRRKRDLRRTRKLARILNGALVSAPRLPQPAA